MLLRKRPRSCFSHCRFRLYMVFISKAQRAGESVKALIAEMPTATDHRYPRTGCRTPPKFLPIIDTGNKYGHKYRVEVNIAEAIPFMASLALCEDLYPASKRGLYGFYHHNGIIYYRSDCQYQSEQCQQVYTEPATAIKANVPMMETIMTRSESSVARISCRKKYTTSTTRTIANSNDLITSSIDA